MNQVGLHAGGGEGRGGSILEVVVLHSLDVPTPTAVSTAEIYTAYCELLGGGGPFKKVVPNL